MPIKGDLSRGAVFPPPDMKRNYTDNWIVGMILSDGRVVSSHSHKPNAEHEQIFPLSRGIRWRWDIKNRLILPNCEGANAFGLDIAGRYKIFDFLNREYPELRVTENEIKPNRREYHGR